MYYFTSRGHKDNLERLLDKVGDKTASTEYQSALYLLSIPYIYDNADKHISNQGIDFDSILQNDFSSAELFIVRVAKVLFKSAYPGKIDLSDILYLDNSNTRAFIQAISIRTGLSPLEQVGQNSVDVDRLEDIRSEFAQGVDPTELLNVMEREFKIPALNDPQYNIMFPDVIALYREIGDARGLWTDADEE
jgi:hypothetical protein